MESLETIRKKLEDAIVIAIQAMKEIPPMKDLRRYINLSEPTLEKELKSCQTNVDILELVRSKCSVSDITPLESIVVKFKVEGVQPSIEDYRASISTFYEKLPLSSYFQGSADKFTLLIDQDVDDNTFNEIKNLITQYARQFGLDLNLFVTKDD